MSVPAAGACRIRPREHCLAFLFFAVLALAGMWSQAPIPEWGTTLQTGDIDGSYLAAVMWWTRQALPASPMHVLDAPFFYPAAHASTASDHVLSLALLSTPFSWLCPNAMFAYRLTTLLMVAGAGWGMWWFVARLTGDRWAALLAGTVWAMGPHTFLSLNRAHVMPCPFWAPLACVLATDAEKLGKARFAACAALLVAAAWTGWYMTLFTAFLMACWCVAAGLVARPRPFGAWALRMAGLGAVTGTALLPLLVAYEQEVRTVYFSSDLLIRNRVLPWQVFMPSGLTLIGRMFPKIGAASAEFPEAYLGIVPWLAMGAAAVACARRPTREAAMARLRSREIVAVLAFAAILFVTGLVFAAGPRIHVRGHDIHLPLAWMGRLFEPLKFGRWSARYAMLSVFGLAAGAGIAASAVRAAWPSALGGRRGAVVLVAACLLAMADATPLVAKVNVPLHLTPVLDRLAERGDVHAVAEVPVRDMSDTTEAMVHMTRHRRPIVHGYSDIGFGPPNLEDFLNLWPEPVARAAVEVSGVDALLLVPGRMDALSPIAVPAGWRELDRDEHFVLVAPDGEVPADVAGLIADLEPPLDAPEPILLEENELAGRMWLGRVQFDGSTYWAGVDAATAVSFDPPIDARTHRRITIRMRLLEGPASPEATQIFWTGPEFPQENERRTEVKPVPVDGEWHDVVFDFSRDPRWVWCGEISRIRWDPTRNGSYRFQVQSIRID